DGQPTRAEGAMRRQAEGNASAHNPSAKSDAPTATSADVRPESGAVPRGSEEAARLDRAKQAGEAGRHAEAENLLREVLAAYPDDYQAHFYQGLTLVRRRRFAEAHEHVGRALEINRS